MSLLERIGLLMLLDVFELIPDGRGTGVSIVQQGHARWLRVEELQLHILLDACRERREVKIGLVSYTASMAQDKMNSQIPSK